MVNGIDIMQKAMFALLLISVVAVAGCISGGGFQGLFGQPGEVKEAPADVIQVSDINIIPSSVSPDETFELNFKVINTGDFPVENVGVLLYDWGLCTASTTTGFTAVGSSAYFKDMGELVPQQTEFFELGFTAPTKAQTGGLEATCPVRWKVNYTMESVSTSTAQVINADELKRLQRSGESASFSPTTTIGPGPVKISLSWGASLPVKSGNTLPLFIQVEDKGTGALRDIVTGNLDLRIPKDLTMDTDNCGGYFKDTTNTDGDFKIYTNNKTINMVQKESIQVRCGLTAPSVDVTKVFTVIANYTYSYDLAAEQSVSINTELTG